MISKTLYNIAALFFLIKGISGIAQIYGLIVESEATGYSFPATMYLSPLLFIVGGLSCWYLACVSNDMLAREDSLPISENRSLSIGLFLLGLYFLGIHLPELVEKYIQYRELGKMGMVGEALVGPTSALWVLGTKSCFGLILVALSFNAKAVFYTIRKLGA